MRQRSRARRKQRIAIALTVVSALVAAFAALQLFGGNGDTASSSPSPAFSDGEGSLGLGPGASSAEEQPSSDKTASDPSGENPLAALPNPYAASRGSNRLYKVTLQLVSDGAVYEGHDYRDGKRAGSSVVNKSITITRTVRGPLPLARIGGQVLSNATYATCSISLDGTVVSTRTARKPGYVTVCIG